MSKKNFNFVGLVVFLVVVTVLSRLISHAWNFTILGGVALFSAAFFAQRFVAVIVVLLSLLISDAWIGFHSQMLAVYFGFMVMVALGSLLSINSSRLSVLSTAVLGSFLFFLISNFFVWYQASLYPLTLDGLANCYLMGVEFYRAQLVGDVVSTFALFELAKALKSFIAAKFEADLVKI